MPTSRLPTWRLPVAYLLTALVFLALDAVWLSTATQPVYRPAIGHLMAAQVQWVPVALFYAGYFAALVYFAVNPALAAGRATVALGRGVALGLLAYGTYDFTNQATLRDWPWHLTLVDLCWGAFNTGVSCLAGAAATSRLLTRAAAR